MKIKEITASYSVKKQVRQYEPINVSMSVTAEVSEGDDVETAQEQIFDIAKEMVDKMIRKVTND